MSTISRQISALGSASRLRIAPSAATKSARCASSTAGNSAVGRGSGREGGFRPTASARQEGEEDDGPDDSGDITFQSWLKNVGSQYKNPVAWKTNYITGADFPFPMNPSFRPPPPLGDDLRTTLFNLHITDPEANSLRELSSRFGLSPKRIEAVIRLKGEEVKWKMEGRTLRKNFEKVMQSSMAVRAYKNSVTLRPMQQHARQADMDAEAEGASTTPKKGVEKLWWEGVEDGKEAVVGPHILARAASLAQKTAESEAASAQFAASHSHVVEPTVPGRSPTVFVDVGSKFVDAKDVAKREKAADARRRLKEKKKVA